MEDTLVPLVAIAVLFIGLPWIILHYISKWRTAPALTTADENLLEDLYDLSRRLDDRICTIERIMEADNPDWRMLTCEPGGVPAATSSRGFEAARLGGAGRGDQPEIMERAGSEPRASGRKK